MSKCEICVEGGDFDGKNSEIMKDGNNNLCEQWNLVLSNWVLFDEDIPQEKL